MALIRVGRLLPGGVIVDEGQHKPLRAMAMLPVEGGQSEEIVVFAKKLSSREMSIEIVCAALGRKLSLPIPEPVILFDADNTPYFGSVDATYPSFAQYIRDSEDKSVKERLASWPLLKSAAYFDEWIAMDDRSNGNLLFNGDTFFLIDHESAIPPGMLPDQHGIDYYSNQLLQIANFSLDRTNELSVQMNANEARAWSSKYKDSVVSETEDEIEGSITDKTKNQLISFLNARIEQLGDILYNQIKPKQEQIIYDVKS
ncbi:hypothetical protein SIN39_003464 [Yersinia enterocolitica]|nr:hypothetical protein [Yersinia enterocolitica]